MDAMLASMPDVDIEPSSKRKSCDRCRRPATVCWCPFLPVPAVDVQTRVYLLQHPCEEGRNLKTAPILFHGLAQGKCHIIKGKRFSRGRHQSLHSVLRQPETLLLYPGPDAEDLTTLTASLLDQYNGQLPSCNLILLDGTWAQAKAIYNQNPVLSTIRKVHINHNCKSKYVIRTQPADSCLSTLESAALALATLEQRPNIFELLTRPLEAMCAFQLQHGAVTHQSKEFLINNGLYPHPVPRSAIRKLHSVGAHITMDIR